MSKRISWIFDKKSALGSGIKSMSNQSQLADELYKRFIKKI